MDPSLEREFSKLNLCMGSQEYLMTLEVKPNLEAEITAMQVGHPSIEEIKAKIPLGKAQGFSIP
jgi:hypothetical protein